MSPSRPVSSVLAGDKSVAVLHGEAKLAERLAVDSERIVSSSGLGSSFIDAKSRGKHWRIHVKSEVGNYICRRRNIAL
jgi:hypothetical protein